MTTEDQLEAGSISALGLNIKNWYKVGTTSSKEVKRENLLLIDIQYLGKRDAQTFLDSISSPSNNSLFLGSDSNIDSIICDESPKKSKNNDVVTRYAKRYQEDDLKCYYTDYDSIVDSLVRREVFAGSVTKMRRLPVISVYKAGNLSFIEALADNKGSRITSENKTNFIIYSKTISQSSAKAYLIGNASKLSYSHSYTVDPKTMKLKRVTGAASLTSYQTHQSSDFIINGCDMARLIYEASSGAAAA